MSFLSLCPTIPELGCFVIGAADPPVQGQNSHVNTRTLTQCARDYLIGWWIMALSSRAQQALRRHGRKVLSGLSRGLPHGARVSTTGPDLAMQMPFELSVMLAACGLLTRMAVKLPTSTSKGLPGGWPRTRLEVLAPRDRISRQTPGFCVLFV